MIRPMATKQVKRTPPETPEAIRVAAGLTPEQVAAHPDGVAPATLAKVEGGQPGVTTRTLRRLADIYGCSVSRLGAAYFARMQGAA